MQNSLSCGFYKKKDQQQSIFHFWIAQIRDGLESGLGLEKGLRLKSTKVGLLPIPVMGLSPDSKWLKGLGLGLFARLRHESTKGPEALYEYIDRVRLKNQPVKLQSR